MKKLLVDCLTGKDGTTFDMGRLLWAWGVISFTGLAGYSVVYLHAAFDAVGYGTGFAGVLAAGGAALGFKAKTEPDPPAGGAS
ncbi:MAG: hypothetical protein KGN77_01915 [Xanthomonadaceae bacterium]|nr:hypothetical protein [Xanthomonadaceae bacterium]